MLAQYRCGAENDALVTFRRLCALLEESGRKPSWEIETLEHLILLRSPTLRWTDPNAGAD